MKRFKTILVILIVEMQLAKFGISQTLPQKKDDRLRKVESAMLNGKIYLSEDKIEAAKFESKTALKTLNQLLNIYLPLDERIKKAIKIENEIAEETKYLSEKKSKFTKEFIQNKQVENIDQTQISLNQSRQQRKIKPDQLNKINSYLEKALKFGNLALENIGISNYSSALEEEIKAKGYLEKALKTMNNKPLNKNQKGEKNNKSQKEKKQHTGQDQTQNKKKSNSDENKKNTISKKQKTSPQEALERLSKLQRRQESKIKADKEKYGIKLKIQKIPTQKDW